MKRVNVNVDLMQVLVTINNIGTKINAGVNAKNWLIKVYVIKDFFWNPSNCECECDIGEYLDYENCKCRKKLVNKLVEECTENVNGVKIAGMALFEHENERVSSYTICVVLAVVIVLTINIGIGAYFAYKYMNRNRNCC